MTVETEHPQKAHREVMEDIFYEVFRNISTLVLQKTVFTES